MAIRFYPKGKLSSGFHGWHVTATLRGKRFQKYLSLNPPNSGIPADFWHRYQETRARYYDARWKARYAALQYIDFLKTNHPNTRPYRGVGFRGITLGITSGDRVDQERCYISVNNPSHPMRFFITQEESLTAAWNNAVQHWGKVFRIRPKDIDRKRQAPPSPDRFKELRKQLNDKEGNNISVQSLHHVYAEKRAQLEHQKAVKNTKGQLNQDELLAMYSKLEREIAGFRR